MRWVLDLGYVGSSGINLNDYNHNQNQAHQLCNSDHDALSSSLHRDSLPSVTRPATLSSAFQSWAMSLPVWQASDFDGYSNYNSLQATVRHQFSPRPHHPGGIHVGQGPLRHLLRQRGEHQQFAVS